MKWTPVLLLSLLVCAPAAAQQKAGEARPWEHESSDVPLDPGIHFGHLKNGMRWAWAANGEPEERTYLRLHVNVGSIAEEDTQRGMAHFLEHMAFNGSEHFAAGELVEWFQAQGMGFGSDTNAWTGFGETVYVIDLPRSDAKTLGEGMRVLRDVAGGLLLAPKEIEAEKGVIDAEERERASPQQRVTERMLDELYGGTRVGVRMPIGKKAIRDAFTAESVRAFYEKWYRPENMTLIVVGDLGDLDPAPLIEEAFASLEAPATPPAPEPALGKPNGYSHTYWVNESELPTLTITVQRLKPWEDEPFTVAEWLEDMPVQYARNMLNLRFRELAKKEDAPFMSAQAGGAGGLRIFEGETLRITCAPDAWEAAVTAAEQELRRALQFGFQEAELEELRADELRGLDEAVERAKTRSSQSYLQELLSAAEHDTVPTDAATNRKILAPAIKALTVEACHEALVKAWAEGELSIFGQGALDLDAAKLKAAWTSSQKIELKAPEKIAVDAFAYASKPEDAGEVAAREANEELGFVAVRFANGVLLNVKKTDFQKNQVLIQARLGEGALTLEGKAHALYPAVFGFASQIVGAAFAGGGLAKHTDEDLRRLTAGKQVGVGFDIGPDAFVLGGSTTSSDLLLQCELMCAYLQDPGWRDEAIGRIKMFLPQIYGALDMQHQGPLMQKFLPGLYGDDPRFAFPSQEEVAGVSMDQLREWLAPHLASGALEVTIVGDVDVDAVVAASARTFGALPKRDPIERYEARRKVPALKTGWHPRYEIATTVPKTMVVVVYRATDGIESGRRRRLFFLSQVLNDRLRVEIREKLGATYSPGAGLDVSQVYPGDGKLLIQAMAEPHQAKELLDACLAVTDSLAKDGVTQEEVDRLREPILNQVRDMRRQNGYWQQVLAQAQTDPDSLADIDTLEGFYEKVTAEELSELAAKYLTRERASSVLVAPKGMGPAEEPAESKDHD